MKFRESGRGGTSWSLNALYKLCWESEREHLRDGWPGTGGEERAEACVSRRGVTGLFSCRKGVQVCESPKIKIPSVQPRPRLSPLLTDTEIPFGADLSPPSSPLSSREGLGSLRGLDNCALEKNEPGEAWLGLFSVRNISKLGYKRPPRRQKNL